MAHSVRPCIITETLSVRMPTSYWHTAFLPFCPVFYHGFGSSVAILNNLRITEQRTPTGGGSQILKWTRFDRNASVDVDMGPKIYTKKSRPSAPSPPGGLLFCCVIPSQHPTARRIPEEIFENEIAETKANEGELTSAA